MSNSVLWTPLIFGFVGLFLPKRMTGWWAVLGTVVTLGLAIAILAGFDSGASGLQNAVDVNWIPGLGVVIGLAMMCNLAAAALGGILIPLGLHRLRVDPAVASSPFVTTVTDVVGFFSFLAIATVWFGLK